MYNTETCDYLHKLELVPLKYHDEAKLAKALKEVRKQRWQAKDDTIVLKPIVDWMAENEPVIRSTEKQLASLQISAKELAQEACKICREYAKKDCRGCRIKRIMIDERLCEK